MTEYQQANGSATIPNGHQKTDLEDSILSLISSTSNQESTILNDQSLKLKNSYRKAAKLFINRKFDESFKIVDALLDLNLKLFEQGKIDQQVYVSFWSLYFNLIDIFINKNVKTLSNQERSRLDDLFFGDELFEKLYSSNDMTPPKLVLLLTLIKLNNEKTDLEKLRSKLGFYMEYAPQVYNAEKDEDYKELLEVYHVHLLVKMGKIQEAEFLIGSDPNIIDKKAMLEKLKLHTVQVEEDAKNKKELEKQKRAKQKKKEQKLKELKASKRASTEQQQQQEKLLKEQSQQEDKQVEKSDFITVLDLIKKKFWFLNTKSTPIIVLSILAIVILGQNKLTFNNRIKQQIRSLWNKLATTLQMAFQVTYV